MYEGVLRIGLALAVLVGWASPHTAQGDTWKDYPPPYDEFEPGYNNENRANTQVWLKAAEAPGYAEATACTPAYENRKLWPGLTGKEKYPDQEWERVPILVWNHPGESGPPLKKTDSICLN